MVRVHWGGALRATFCASMQPDRRCAGITTTLYDSRGDITSVTDPVGQTTTYQYDNAGQQTAVIDGLGGTTTMQYDANGNMTAETDPDGNVTTFQYDGDGRQTVEINPLGNKTTTVYNSQGEVSTITDAWQEQVFSCDTAGRETGDAWKNSGGNTVNTFTYTYDSSGNELTAANNAGTYTMTYNNNNDVATMQGLVRRDADRERRRHRQPHGIADGKFKYCVSDVSRTLTAGWNSLRGDSNTMLALS